MDKSMTETREREKEKGPETLFSERLDRKEKQLRGTVEPKTSTGSELLLLKPSRGFENKSRHRLDKEEPPSPGFPPSTRAFGHTLK